MGVKGLHNKLWKIFSLYIRHRDAFGFVGDDLSARCITCQKVYSIKRMDAGHFISRGQSATKYHEQNVHAQCKGCNITGEQYQHGTVIDQRYGLGTAEGLYRLSKKEKRFTVEELENMIIEYKEKLDEFI